METHKKIGFWLSIAMIIGSVVGIGIFFKNGSISRAVDGDGASWLIAWILGGIISIGTALSFSEIGSFKDGKLSGLSNWVYKVTKSEKLAYHNALGYAIFYWGILNTVIGIFSSEAFFFFLKLTGVALGSLVTVWTHVLVGLIFTAFFVTMNIMSARVSGKFQFIITIIKFLPLFFALLIGIIFPETHNNNGSNAFLKQAFSIKGIIVALPAVLFAYDAFLVSSSISKKTENPTRTLPKAILIGMIFIVILYSLIAISSILHSSGTIHGLIADALPSRLKDQIAAIIIFFVFLSSLGVVNGISSAFVNEMHMLVKNRLLFGSKALLKKFSEWKTTIFYIITVESFYLLTFILPSIVLDTDILIDGISNFTTLFFFVVYGLVIFGYTIKRNKHNETKKINNILFYAGAIISIFGILFVEVSYLYLQFENLSSDKTNPSGWGVFWDNEKGSLIKNYVPLVVYLVTLTFLISMPWLNYAMEKIVFKRDIIKDLLNQNEEYTYFSHE
ncbi:amino acid permease [Mycoplasmopsis canis PG 14]|uniref:Serine/threonine exchanger SteT n=1 Tax=Mycoplasmopsis canis TaxID=29555 RepID=A0A449ARY1_9BACT|nr:APC family permease [Mycoplasmopsis canis]AMD81486.1 amino acid permease [Mycoplasmopsis canis PG 14]EIE39495.1 amino acid permease [Mycoplasmopsis canis PG 14]VEU69116.1 Serine/threonine exchanger SteT [Mycoplasmopsis canis]